MLTVGCGMPAIPSPEASLVFPRHSMKNSQQKNKTFQNIAHAQSSQISWTIQSPCQISTMLLNDIMILNLLTAI